MPFYKLFLKVSTILFLAFFCAAETRALLPEQDQTNHKTPPKRTLNDFETASKRQKVDEDDPAFLDAVATAEKEYLETPASQEAASPTKAQELREDKNIFHGFSYHQLITPEDHKQYLIYAIHSAKRSLLVTSYNFSADMSGGSDLFEAVRAACVRGVKLYFYANKILLEENRLDSLRRLRNLLFDVATIHSKLLIVDNKQITCGSYDWLAEPWNGVSQNASLILEGGELKPMVDHIWDVLKKYRTVDFNPNSLGKVEKTLRMLPPLYMEFKNPNNSFEVLNTPYEHGEIFEGCFEEAQRQLTFCAPFITGDANFLQEILPQKMLIPFLRSGKKLNIFYRAGDEKINLLKEYMDQILSFNLKKNVTLTPVDGLHRKSLFVDEGQYIEGSYNWLSSARNLDDPYYFMESSLRFTGTWAKELIREFYKTVLNQ